MNNIKIKEINFIQIMQVVRTLTKEDYGYINGHSFMISDLTSSILRLGIYVENCLAGFCVVHLSSGISEEDQIVGDITIAINPKYRGLGLSRYLLDEVKNRMKNNTWGITRLYYGVLKGNKVSNVVAKSNNFNYLGQDELGYKYYCDL